MVTIRSAINLTVSQSGVPDNIGLGSVLKPILPTHAGSLLLGAMLLLLTQNFRRNRLCGRDDLIT
jgi:hypothetical protein